MTLKRLMVTALVFGTLSCGGDHPTQPITPPAPYTVALTAPSLLTAGDSAAAAAAVSGGGGGATPSIAWTTSDPAVAAVGANGMIRGVGVGSATITATAAGAVASSSVRVIAPWPLVLQGTARAGEPVTLVVAGQVLPSQTYPLRAGANSVSANRLDDSSVVALLPADLSGGTPMRLAMAPGISAAAVIAVAPASPLSGAPAAMLDSILRTAAKAAPAVIGGLDSVAFAAADARASAALDSAKRAFAGSTAAVQEAVVRLIGALPAAIAPASQSPLADDASGCDAALTRSAKAQADTFYGYAVAVVVIFSLLPVESAVGLIAFPVAVALALNSGRELSQRYTAAYQSCRILDDFVLNQSGLTDRVSPSDGEALVAAGAQQVIGVSGRGRTLVAGDIGTVPGAAELQAITQQASQAAARFAVTHITLPIPTALDRIVTPQRVPITLASTRLTWSSSDPSIATVTASGTVTGVAVGTATITAALGSVTHTMVVRVVPMSGTLALDQSTLALMEGASQTLKATVRDTTGQAVAATPQWTSSNSTVATVSQAGLVVGVKSGTAQITVTYRGLTAGALVTVSAKPLAFAGLSLGDRHSCGLTQTGAAYCWGDNQTGMLGDGTTTNRLTPTAVAGGFTFTSLEVGYTHMCALTAAGAGYCWGDNGFGGLGDGTTTNRWTPTPVAGGLTFMSLGAGLMSTCGLTQSGGAYCWGLNKVGELGDGTTTDRLTPTPVTGGLTFASLGVGYRHACGLTRSGAAYCWGDNGTGWLGDGTTTNRSTPTAVTGGLTFVSLRAGAFHTCGLTGRGTVYCWGGNAYGQLGDGTTTDRLTPILVTGGLTFVSLSTANDHTCGLTRSGAAYCWGDNGAGGIGDGTTVNRSTPILVTGGLTFVSLSTGTDYTCGVIQSAAAYCWGFNNHGQLGDGTMTSRSTPVPVRTSP